MSLSTSLLCILWLPKGIPRSLILSTLPFLNIHLRLLFPQLSKQVEVLMYSMLFYFMCFFWKDHVFVHMFKNQIMHRILNEEMLKFWKILSFLENSPLCSFLLLSSIKLNMLMEKVMIINIHDMHISKSKRDIGGKKNLAGICIGCILLFIFGVALELNFFFLCSLLHST